MLIAASWFGAFFVSLARRMPESRFARATVGAANTVRGWAWYAWVSLSSWSSAGRKAVRLRAEQRRLRHEQERMHSRLPEAVYGADEARAEELKTEAQALGKRIDKSERELQLALEAARSRIGRRRSAIRPTQVLTDPPPRKSNGKG